MKSELGQGLTRRRFVKGMAAGSLGVAASAALIGCGSAGGAASSGSEKWDHEADVVVLGYGGAGAAAAINAKKAGATVLILEKMPEEDAGGDMVAFGGSMVLPPADVMVLNSFGQMDQATAKVTYEKGAEWLSWFNDEMGLKYEASGTVEGKGNAVYAVLKKGVEDAGVDKVLYNTPAKRLIQDTATKEIRGVIAEQDGKEIRVKASKCVIIATGGYSANNDLLKKWNRPGLELVCCGSPASTGEGLLMGAAAGAELSNLGTGVEFFELAFAKASRELGTGLTVRQWRTSTDPKNPGAAKSIFDSRVFVSMAGKRFMNEAKLLVHDKGSAEFLDFIDPMGEPDPRYVNLPAFMVCDDACVKSVPLGRVTGDDWTWAYARGIYAWSDDNQAEVEKGWLIKADTIEELAAKMTAKRLLGNGEELKMDVDALKATIGKYNADAVAGKDEFGKAGAQPVLTPPFYAAELCASVIYTIGGLKANENSQTLDAISGEPIPRLYDAGCVGEGTGGLPICLLGCIARGGIAGTHGADLESWA